MKRQWEVIHDADDEETGEQLMWSSEINDSKYGKYIWICKMDDDKFIVQTDDGTIEMKTLVTCKTLTSAKRCVSNKFN